jgi:hypothetical protein
MLPNAELFCVLAVQQLPAGELQGLGGTARISKLQDGEAQDENCTAFQARDILNPKC